MSKKSETYVVGILFTYEDRTEIKFVTDLKRLEKEAYWNNDEEAMTFSKEYAKDLALGLCINGHVAIPMLKASYLNLSNAKSKKEEV